MFNLTGSEIIVILLLALVVLGPEKLPDALRRAGRTYAELKKMGSTFQTEMKSVLDEPMQEMRETADLLRKAVDFEAVADVADDSVAKTGNRATPPKVESTPEVLPGDDHAPSAADAPGLVEPAADEPAATPARAVADDPATAS